MSIVSMHALCLLLLLLSLLWLQGCSGLDSEGINAQSTPDVFIANKTHAIKTGCHTPTPKCGGQATTCTNSTPEYTVPTSSWYIPISSVELSEYDGSGDFGRVTCQFTQCKRIPETGIIVAQGMQASTFAVSCSSTGAGTTWCPASSGVSGTYTFKIFQYSSALTIETECPTSCPSKSGACCCY